MGPPHCRSAHGEPAFPGAENMANTQSPPAQRAIVGSAYEVRSTPLSEVDIELPALDTLAEELQRLSAVNQELLGQLREPAAPAPAGPEPGAGAGAGADAGELDALRRDNAELRARLEELEQFIAAQPTEEVWAERQREYEALLDEKSEVIRALHLKLQEAQEGPRRSANEPVPREEELRELQAELEEHRRQLQEDEQSLLTQMREMELALSKDRAELARQRQELQRLRADLNREIDQASRDPGLRERLMSLRRSADVARAETKEAAPAPAANSPKQQSGLFRRLFG